MGYILDNNVRYGALSSYARTWFFRADSVDQVAISDAVQDSQSNPTALRAWAYLLHLGREASDLLKEEAMQFLVCRLTAFDVEDEDGDEDEDEDSVHHNVEAPVDREDCSFKPSSSSEKN